MTTYSPLLSGLGLGILLIMGVAGFVVWLLERLGWIRKDKRDDKVEGDGGG